MGWVDILVNNVGIICCYDVLIFMESDWDVVIDLNFKVVFFFSQVVVRQFICQGEGGKIINIVLMLLFQGGICVFFYIVLKSGVLGLICLLVNEWVGQGINVNVIVFGYMVINNIQVLCEDEECNQVIFECIFVGCWGVLKDLQGLVVFFVLLVVDYINGYMLVVDGGWLVC